MSKNRQSKGISLLEILVVVSVFAILGILITRSVLLTLGGGRKSESLIKVRENLNYSIGIMERQLRNANSIIDCSNANTSLITYTDQNGNPSSFSCVTAEGIGYIASGSAKISSSTVNVTGCTFTCLLGTGVPSSVTINLEATDASASGLENSVVTTTTQVFLRNY
jgi:type II secretory pathway component PulJ